MTRSARLLQRVLNSTGPRFICEKYSVATKAVAFYNVLA